MSYEDGSVVKKALAALTKNSEGSGPITHFRSLTDTCNFSPNGSGFLFHLHTQVKRNTHKLKNNPKQQQKKPQTFKN